MNAAFDYLGMAEACIDLGNCEDEAVRFELLVLAEMLLDLADDAVKGEIHRPH